MTRPEDALERARREAERRRAAGDYPPAAGSASDFDRAIEGRVTPEQLREWALIEVDPDLVYSVRPLGAPITALKRLLLRLLRQYTNELEAQQTRFNVGVLARLEEIERERKNSEV